MMPDPLMAAPGGGETRMYVKPGGTSGSVAELLTVISANSLTVRLVCAGSTGGLLTSRTTTVNELVAVICGKPLSVTMVVIVFVPGPCASLGVHVMMPFVSIIAPAGGLTRE